MEGDGEMSELEGGGEGHHQQVQHRVLHSQGTRI